MKKVAFFIFLSLFLYSSCSIFRTKVIPYPEGIMFPLEVFDEIIYSGEIVDLIQKESGNVYFSTYNGYIYCIDGQKRKVLWRYDSSSPIDFPPSISNGKVFFFDKNNILYCLNIMGKFLWKTEIKESVSGSLKEISGKVYLGTMEGNFIAIESSSGKEIWRFKTGKRIKTNPVFWKTQIIFGSENGNVYFLNQKGEETNKLEMKSGIETDVLVDENHLYFNSQDHFFYCFDLEKRKIKWKVGLGGNIVSAPVIEGKSVFVVSKDNVLYTLNKNNGSILWWQSLPSLAHYRLEIIKDKIIASSLAPNIVCFNLENGVKHGEFIADKEVRSNPLWFDSHLLFNTYDHINQKGKLHFMRKMVKAEIISSRESPVRLGVEVVFNVSAIGFFRPEYEFYLKVEESREIVQEKSRMTTWSWYPKKSGKFVIGVSIMDIKGEVFVEIPFTVEKE